MEHSMASPVAPATEPAAVSQAESAPAASTVPEDFDFDRAFTPAALSASKASAAPASVAAVGEPVAEETTDAVVEVPASTPDGQEQATEGEPKLSRRQQLETERQAELAAAKAEWQAERDRADAAEKESATLREAEQQRVQTYLTRMGNDAEFNRRNGLPSSELTYEEQVELDGWKLARTDRDLLEKDAWLRVTNPMAVEAQRVAGLPGVDPEVVQKTPTFGAICEHFYEAGGKAVRTELQDKIAQLEADNRALLAQRVGQARQPESGGASPPAGPTVNPNAWNPDLDANAAMDAAFGAPALRRAS